MTDPADDGNTPTATDGENAGKKNPFTAADVRSEEDYYLEFCNSPTSRVRDEKKEIKARLDKARALLGSNWDIKALTGNLDFSADEKEASHQVADATAKLAGLRRVLNMQITASKAQEDEGEDRPAARHRRDDYFNGYDGPGLVTLLADAAEAEGRPRFDFEDQFKFVHECATLREHPILNAVFEREAANPWQDEYRELDTLRESPAALLRIFPMSMAMPQETVPYQAQTLDTVNAQERDEGELAAEEAYRWAWFRTFIRSISTSIPVTDESIADGGPDAEARIVRNLMGGLRIRLCRQLVKGTGGGISAVPMNRAAGQPGSGAGTEILGVLNATKFPGDGTVAPDLLKYDDHLVTPSGRKVRSLNFVNGDYDRAVLFDTIRLAIGDIEDGGHTDNHGDGILDHREASHLVCKGNMTTAMDLTRLSQSAAAVHAAGANPAQTAEIVREGEYVLGGPLAGRFAARPWGLQVVRSNYGLASNANKTFPGFVGCMNSRVCELQIRKDSELRRGFVDDQFRRFMSTFAAELRAALVLYDPAAFCALERSN